MPSTVLCDMGASYVVRQSAKEIEGMAQDNWERQFICLDRVSYDSKKKSYGSLGAVMVRIGAISAVEDLA